jgi:SAM-dependent methyltransferase
MSGGLETGLMRKLLFDVLYSYIEHTRPHPGRGMLMKLATRVYPEGIREAYESGRLARPVPAGVNGATKNGTASHPEAKPATALSHNKVCALEDFSSPELVPIIREVFRHDVERLGPSFPTGFEYRKHWEVAMAVRALSEAGVLHENAEILGVGAGNEPTIFWLTNKVRRVFATDLYLNPGRWTESANPSMMVAPSRHWPRAWNPRRLVVQHMNALDLAYEDNSFDGIFSSSSIEHFGTHDDVRRAMREMFRVLRPGGLLTLATEYRIDGPSPGMPGVLMFDADELQRVLIGDLSWSLVSSLDLTVTEATRRAVVPFAVFQQDLGWHLAQHGEILLHRFAVRHYPLIAFEHHGLVWTSIHLALRKAG